MTCPFSQSYVLFRYNYMSDGIDLMYWDKLDLIMQQVSMTFRW